MDAAKPDIWHLLAWTPEGRRVLDRPLGPKTLSLSSRQGGDVGIPELGTYAVFVRLSGDGATLYLHDEQGAETRLALAGGYPATLGPLTWMLARPPAAATAAPGDDGGRGGRNLLASVVAWMAQPMATVAELKAGLTELLELLVAETPATSGMLVLAEGEGFNLVCSSGLGAKDAQRLWEKMPPSLAQEILRTKARMLLPEELKQERGVDSTVFVRGVRSVAGFPVLAEGRVMALFYLGFDNLLRSLSPPLQKSLESSADVLGMVLQRAHQREQIETLKLKAATPAANLPAGRLMVGVAPRLLEVYHLLTRLAPVDVPALILGETGTGKELAAKELHRLSTRAKGPFIVVNAAALPEALIESELFGHRKGSFTGALTDRDGLVEQANGGTLFIDEIGELPLAMQAKLLRVLQERAVTRIGEAQPRAVDFRLVSATHRDLPDLVAQAKFREDLYYRVAGAVIHMPALRDRPEDIVTLASHFRAQFAERHGLPDKEWSAEALLTLEARAWPGNVRELENVVARAFVMAEGPVIRAADLGEPRAGATGAAAPAEPTLMAARDAWMKGFLIRALRRHNGRRSETAKALGIGERTLFRYLDQLAIEDSS